MVSRTVPARGGEPRSVIRGARSIPRWAAASSPTPSACSRCSRTCSRTPSSSRRRAACGSTSRPPPAAGRPTIRCSVRPARRGLRGLGHRHRHPAREAADHLRGVPAGRRQHEPQVRRHRPRPRDQPRAGQPARRRDPAAQHARRRQHLHALPAAALRRRPAASTRAERARRSADCRRGSRRAPRRSDAAERSYADDRDDVAARRCDAADRRGRSALRAHPGRPRPRQGLQGPRRACAARRRSTLARQFQPTAVSLDVFLPDMLGWTVLSQLKQDPAPGTSRCRSSRSTKTASTAWRAARSRSSPSRRRPRASRPRIDAHQGRTPSRGASVCSSSRTTPPSS